MFRLIISLVVLLVVVSIALGKLTRFLRAIHDLKHGGQSIGPEERFKRAKKGEIIEVEATKVNEFKE
ncbi:MAG: hypothetical protein PHD76_05870 [Methylacidiphilales bacterium]|nr:hypothetical protein [Candidatus Methylacidiphilales bacterium]